MSEARSFNVETSENANHPLLQTHYYKTIEKTLKEAFIKVITNMGYTVTDVSQYDEVLAVSEKMNITAKIFSTYPNETCLDFLIDSYYFFSRSKIKKELIKIYMGLEALVPFKGLSLNKGK